MGTLRLTRFLLLDGVWWLVLALYLFRGVGYIDYHADENNHIYMSRDYITAFIERRPDELAHIFDSEGDFSSFTDQLRLIDAPVHAYIIGFAWHISGLLDSDLPRGSWRWSQPFAVNMQDGRIPSEVMLYVARMASTALLALSVVVMFALGWLFGGRPLAYLTSGLYALNPMTLQHGRRAMHEAPLLLFGLLTLTFALLIARQRQREGRAHWLYWLALTVCGGLTIASKHTGLVFIIGALALIVINELVRVRYFRAHHVAPLLKLGLQLVSCGLLMLAILIALSPSLWADPLKHIQELIDTRGGTTDIQNRLYVETTSTLPQRLTLLFDMPFRLPVSEWWHAEMVEINAAYRASIWSGIPFGPVVGLLLNLLAAWGIVAALWPRLRPPGRSGALYIGLVIALIPIAGMLILNRLPWGRHYLTIVPLLTLFVAIGAQSLVYLGALTLQKRRAASTELLPSL